MHIFSIFGRLYHINSDTDMHIFSIFGRMYHINSQLLSTLLHLTEADALKNEVQKQVVEGRQMTRKHQLRDDD